MHFKNIIEENKANLAFIVGNGINRYIENQGAMSWDYLLLQLWRRFAPDVFNTVPKGITITAFYDLLDLANDGQLTSPFEIQKEAARLLENSGFQQHHSSFMQKAKLIGAPVLTTNFDMILPNALNLKQYAIDKKGFTDFYPWSTYYGDTQLQSPMDGFGVWYINGFIKYHRSIRLGLSHYMGSVQRARSFIHNGSEANLFNTKDDPNWPGRNTWLQIIFNKDLCMFGLGLEENEVFIHWLMIERAKYFKKFPERRKRAWYVAPRAERPDDRIIGKKYFLESVGFEIIETADYKEIYDLTWK